MLPAGDRSACRQHSKQKIPAVRVRAFWRYVRIGQLRCGFIVHVFLSVLLSTLAKPRPDVCLHSDWMLRGYLTTASNRNLKQVNDRRSLSQDFPSAYRD